MNTRNVQIILGNAHNIIARVVEVYPKTCYLPDLLSLGLAVSQTGYLSGLAIFQARYLSGSVIFHVRYLQHLLSPMLALSQLFLSFTTYQFLDLYFTVLLSLRFSYLSGFVVPQALLSLRFCYFSDWLNSLKFVDYPVRYDSSSAGTLSTKFVNSQVCLSLRLGIMRTYHFQ